MTIVERTSVAVFDLLLAWIFGLRGSSWSWQLQSGPTTKAKPAHLPKRLRSSESRVRPVLTDTQDRFRLIGRDGKVGPLVRVKM
jgi:hypothetical protein